MLRQKPETIITESLQFRKRSALSLPFYSYTMIMKVSWSFFSLFVSLRVYALSKFLSTDKGNETI